MLRHLAGRAGEVVTRAELLAGVWGLEPNGLADTRAVDMTIARLREKLRDPDNARGVIRTVRGRGYMLVRERA